MMKQISTRLLTVLGLCMFFLSACNNSSDFTVKGVVAGADGQLMYLENVGISNVVTPVSYTHLTLPTILLV